MAGKHYYVALLRGINVGGHNIISKHDLKSCFENAGCKKVSTYIQSGNIVFQSGSASTERLTNKIEKALSNQFEYDARAVIIARDHYREMLSKAHRNWGQTDAEKHNALFTFPEITPQEILTGLPPVVKKLEKVTVAEGALFWSASKEGISKTTMMKLAKTKLYKLVTVRNHNTTFKLSAMLEELER